MARLESELMQSIKKRLELNQFSKVVIWFARLNSGVVRGSYGQHIHLLPKGTPDYIAIIRNKNKNISILFIEAKSDTGKLRPEQIEFRNKHHNGQDVIFLECRDIKELDKVIDDVGVDRVLELDGLEIG